MREALAFFRLVATNTERKHLALAAAGLAYNFLMSLIPVLMVVTAVVAYLPLQRGMQDVNSFLVYVVPRQAVPLIDDLLTENQCWKDSWDSIVFSDGKLASKPTATCETQGYVYDAKGRCARWPIMRAATIPSVIT